MSGQAENISGAQPMPEAGQMPVAPRLLQDFASWIQQRTQEGIRKYNTPLETWNDRDARVDRMQEILDFAQYQEQELMEAYDLLQDLLTMVTSPEIMDLALNITGADNIIELARVKLAHRRPDSEARS